MKVFTIRSIIIHVMPGSLKFITVCMFYIFDTVKPVTVFSNKGFDFAEIMINLIY